MNQQTTIQQVTNVDIYHVYSCVGCGTDYQLPVRQWKGSEEEVLPARCCAHCGIDCYEKIKSISATQVREIYLSAWMNTPQTRKSLAASMATLGLAAFSAAQLVLPHFVK